MWHKEVGHICQGLSSGRKLPVQHSDHTRLITQNRLCEVFTDKCSKGLKVKIRQSVPLLDGILSYPVDNLRGQGSPHCHWLVDSSSTNQTVHSWLECLCGLLQCTAWSRWKPLQIKRHSLISQIMTKFQIK